MIDSRAHISPSARVAENVEIGPWTYIGDNVEIGEGCKIASHAVIKGPTRIGKHNKIYSFASIGDDPQDLKYDGEDTVLEIGDHNIIREFTTINRGTIQGGGITRIGDHNLFMAYAHIAHDCQIGNHTIFVNNASLAGHVTVGDYAIFGAFSACHQFVNIGAHSFIAKSTFIGKDILPFLMVEGYEAKPRGLNLTGLKRRGFSRDAIAQLKSAYRIMFRSGHTVDEAVNQLQDLAKDSPEVAAQLAAIEASERGILRG